jgi:hypothetical protein
MNRMDTHFDQMRAWIEGTMPATERAHFERALSADPDLARRTEEMRLVWTATAPGLLATPATRITFDDVVAAGRAGPLAHERRWRRVAAAVVLVAAGALAWYALRGSGDDTADKTPPVVKLHAIPEHAVTTVPPADAPIPDVLASWIPVENGKIRWLESMDEARAVAAVTGAPIFVYGYVQGCPICEGFQANEFKSKEIQDLVAKSVPVAIDLLKLEDAERNELFQRRYPLLELQDDRGSIMRTFAGTFAEVDMRAELENALRDITAPKWAVVRELAAALQRAHEAEQSGKLADAASAFETLAKQHDVPAFKLEGDRGLAVIGAEARSALDAVHEISATDPQLARSELDDAIRRFSGTPFETDLRAVAEAWRPGAPFPSLTR